MAFKLIPKWIRSVLSPLLTGSKMRSMLALMGDTIEEFIGGVKEEIVAAAPKKSVEFELMDLYTCSTNDAIASCAFGLKMNSFKKKIMNFMQLANLFRMPYKLQEYFSLCAFRKCADGYALK